ncbi:MAG: hypothetical protein ACPGU5_00930 [Lishizhenia sp.]
MSYKVLTIEIKNSGLGDQLFHSHLPEIAKKTFGYSKVLISKHSKIKFDAYKKFVWDDNPFVDGYTEEKGIGFEISQLLELVTEQDNLLDILMIKFGLDNGKRQNQPKIYYTPKIISKLKDKIVYDPNFLSWVGKVESEDLMLYAKKKKIKFNYIMKLREGKVLYEPNESTTFIETKTLYDFCDLIASVKKMYCLTSGTATIAAGLNISCMVFYGAEQPKGFHHFKRHEYLYVKRFLLNRIKSRFS